MFVRRHLLALSSLAALASFSAEAQSNDPSFRLHNRTAVTIAELYVSPADEDSWGPDQLGSSVIQAGQSAMVNMPAGQCRNDIRIVFEGGQRAVQRNLNTCNLTDVNVTP